MRKEEGEENSDGRTENVIKSKIEKIVLRDGSIRKISCLYIDRANHENGHKAD